MEKFLICLIICSLGIPTILGKSFYNQIGSVFRQCERELNIAEEKWNAQTDLNDTEVMCAFACTARKSTVESLIGSNDKETLYNGLSKMIEEAYENGFETENFTPEDVVNKIESCYANVPDECQFWICAEVTEGEIKEINLYAGTKNLISRVYNF